MEWLKAIQLLRTGRRAGVLVTVMSVRGHAPREAGAKMVVADDNVWSTVGGGNLEALAISRSRAMIADGVTVPEVLTAALSDKAPYQHGVQCCGGEVKLLLEPLPVVPSVAIFGVGHVGMELARILARHDIELHLVDSRAEQLAPERLRVLDDAVAQVHVHNVPVLPELVVGELPPGTHAVIMTHDHAEDAALCDAAIRTEQLATIGLIGSSAKWTRFQRKLTEDGNTATAIARITTPIGLPDLPGKEPVVIAVSVAAWLLQRFATTPSPAPASSPAAPPRTPASPSSAPSPTPTSAPAGPGPSLASSPAERQTVSAHSAGRQHAPAQREATA
ncbi:xanthine dehydrogenase accessory protein XdhC [Kribbella solani]|uniref:Xanthine dehydrogenase accessory factor n=1 Tax=Kribbella solani TaxID=236067 RepID=A0A841E2L2_9ACTN|nr:xanthine dehydrogenase accessory protein XdhC [Kribbella solani]MBB5981618.1 xanthine dehydrogenase accessory factor [Kribbella solani]